MCKLCFEKAAFQFKTRDDYELYIDLFYELTNKGVIKPFTKVRLDDYFDGTTYKCIYCNEEWAISDPDNRPGGFLLTKELLLNNYKEKSKLHLRRKYLYGSLLIIGGLILLLKFFIKLL